MIIWFVPVFFAFWGLLLTLFARPFLTFLSRKQELVTPAEMARGLRQARFIGIAFLITAAVFAVLILAGVL